MLHWFSVSLSAQGDSALPSLLADDPVLWQRFSGLWLDIQQISRKCIYLATPMSYGEAMAYGTFVHMFQNVSAKNR